MDRLVIWSPEAIEDLTAIAEFITRDSEFYARSVVSRLLAAARSLREQPYIGRIVPEISRDDIRERFVFSYRLIYRIQDGKVVVIAIIHGARHPDTLSDLLGPH